MRFFGDLPREVKSLSFVTFFMSIGFGVQAPALPIFANTLGAGTTAVGAMISSFAIARMASAWPLGRAVTRFGERRTLAVGMAFLSITSVMMGLSQSTWQLILFRGLGGAGSVAFSIAAMSLLLRKSPPDSRGRAVGMFMGAMNVGLVAGPAIGGAMMTVFEAHEIFYLYGAVVALTGVLAMLVMDKDHSVAGSGAHGHIDALSVMDALRSQTFRAAAVANFGLGWIVYGVRASVLPMLLLTMLHEDKVWVGAGLALCALLQVAVLPITGRLSDRFGRKRPLIAGNIFLILCLVLVVSAPSLVTYLLCMAIMGVGAALATTSGSAAIGDITRGQGGSIVAVYQMTADFGMVAGPLVAGALAETSFSLALMASAAVAVVGAGMAMAMPRNTRVATGEPASP